MNAVAWDEVLRICDLPPVDEALRAFMADQTADNAACIIIAVLAAHLAAPQAVLAEALERLLMHAPVIERDAGGHSAVIKARAALDSAPPVAEGECKPGLTAYREGGLFAITYRTADKADAEQVRALLTAPPAAEVEPAEPPFNATSWLTNCAELHPLTKNLVVRFARALAGKLAAAEKKYGYSDGWRSPDWMDECRAHLMEHIAKGDPRDVAAYCAFLWHHGASTAASPPAAEVEKVAAGESLRALLESLYRMGLQDGANPVDDPDTNQQRLDCSVNMALAKLPPAASIEAPAVRGRFRLVPIEPRPECCSPNTGDCCGTKGSGCFFDEEVVRAEKEFDAALGTAPAVPAGETRTSVDSGAYQMAMNVLRRNGKHEVADAVAATAVRLTAHPAAPAGVLVEPTARKPIHITALIDWLSARYRAAGGKEGITDLSAWSEEVMRWAERQHGISFEDEAATPPAEPVQADGGVLQLRDGTLVDLRAPWPVPGD